MRVAWRMPKHKPGGNNEKHEHEQHFPNYIILQNLEKAVVVVVKTGAGDRFAGLFKGFVTHNPAQSDEYRAHDDHHLNWREACLALAIDVVAHEIAWAAQQVPQGARQ